MCSAVLSMYPLSRHFKTEILDQHGPEIEFLSVAQLRALPVHQMFLRLRRINAEHLLIPVEDPSSEAILPVLELMAGVSSARRVGLLYPSEQPKPLTRWRLVPSLVKLMSASGTAQFSGAIARKELHELCRAPRIPLQPRKTKRLLYLNPNLWFGVKAGGSVGHISGVVNALTRAGFGVDFASAGGRLMVSDTANYVELPRPHSFGMPFELNYYRFSRHVAGFLASRIGIGHAFLYQRLAIANYSGAMVSRAAGIPLLTEYNGSEVWVAKNWGRPLRYHAMAAAAEEATLKHSHLVVTISEVLRQELLSRGVEEKRIVCYPNCVDPELFDPGRFSSDDRRLLLEQHGIPSDAVVASFIGTFGQWHGVDVLASAIHNLVESHWDWLRQRKLFFMLIGDGLKMAEVLRILECERCREITRIVGLVPQAEAPNYLAASDILLSPHVPNADGTPFFGSPTKLFEYMAMAKPIIASDLDQIGEVLTPAISVGELEHASPDDRAAVLCRPGNVEDIIQALMFLVDQPHVRVVLGRNARARVLRKYTWDVHVAAILAGFEGLLQS